MKNLIFTLLLSMTYLMISAQSGECVDGNCSNGEGTIVYQNGNKYRGSFKNSQRHGQGTFLWKSGASYVGTWKSGNRHGSGVYEYPDGARYDGNYANDKKNGQGTLYGPNGSVLQSGNWVNGNISSTASNSSDVVSNATQSQMSSYKDELGTETKYISPKSKDRFLNVGYAFEPTFYPYFPSRGDLAPVFLSFELPVGESLRFRMGGFASYSTHRQKSSTLVLQK